MFAFSMKIQGCFVNTKLYLEFLQKNLNRSFIAQPTAETFCSGKALLELAPLPLERKSRSAGGRNGG